MNIWSISQYATPPKYGYGTGHHFLSEQHVANGYNVTIFSSAYNHYMFDSPIHNGLKKEETIDGVQYVWLKCKYYKNTSSYKRIINWMYFILAFFAIGKKKYGNPDITILSSHSLFPVICALWVKYRYKSKLIVEIRDVWPKTIIDVSGVSKYHPLMILMSFCEKIAFKQADWIVSTLPKHDERVKEVLKHDHFQFTCIPQGIPRKLFDSEKKLGQEFIEKYFNNDHFKVGYTGSIGPSNALETIMEVVQMFDKEQQSVKFYFLGDGVSKEQFVNLCADCSNVFFVERIRREYVQSFLKQCDITYDSGKDIELYKYGQSRQKWMDYMYAGKPVVVSYSGYKSLINEAECGSFVPAEDAQKLADEILSYSRKSKEELESIGKKGKEYVLKHRTFEVLAKNYETIFSRLT